MIPTKEQRPYNREREVSSKNGIGKNIQKGKKRRKEGKEKERREGRKKIKISHQTQDQNILKI